MQGLHSTVPARAVPVFGATPPPIIGYSDAMFDPQRPVRLGWILADPCSGHVKGRTGVVSESILQQWLPRETEITIAEAFAGLAMVYRDSDFLKGRDLVWFVDNEAAASALIRGAARPEDLNEIASQVHLLMTINKTRVWVEWIDSHSNVADGLSREGLACALANKLCSELEEVDLEPWMTPERVEAALEELRSI